MDFFSARNARSTRSEQPTTTTLYLIAVAELRGDTHKYMFSMDRAYTSLAQANDRLALLSPCNTIASAHEILRAGEDAATGYQWCSWTAPGAEESTPRFFAEVKRVVLRGVVPTPDVAGETGVGAGPAEKEKARVALEFGKDKPGCVWIVAVSNPERVGDREGVGVEESRPKSLTWTVDSVAATQGQAVARAARLWSDDMLRNEGPFELLSFHYGLARWVLVPVAVLGSLPARPGSGCCQLHRDLADGVPQICLERVQVMPATGLLDVGLPPQAVLFEGTFRPFRSDEERVEEAMRLLREAAGEEEC
ncbi:hypothetical protein Q7P37_004538 [Cladosporium fusiforme]